MKQFEAECEKVGLELNAQKTEVMTINTPAHNSLTTTKAKELAKVSDFQVSSILHAANQSWLESLESCGKESMSIVGVTHIWLSEAEFAPGHHGNSPVIWLWVMDPDINPG